MPNPKVMRIRLRPLEKEDLKLVHSWKNDQKMMSYWFEEPFESFMELEELYTKHIHDLTERRFIIETLIKEPAGLIELIEIDYIHRRAEFEIVIDTKFQGKGFATETVQLIQDYAFKILNLHKLYLHVDKENAKAIHIYKKVGFQKEADLKEEFYTDGQYRDVVRMCIFKRQQILS
jgi:diamine N-acetyltransferase